MTAKKKACRNNQAVDIDYRPININKPTLDRILKEDKPNDLVSLYIFYYYTAIWQKTNQPKATTSYVAKGLKISQAKVRRGKAVLMKLGLIEDVRVHDEKTKQIKHHYIKVKYYISHPDGFRHYGEHDTVENRKTNTYSNSSLNSYSNNKSAGLLPDGEIKKDFFDRYTDKLIKLLRSKRKVMRMPDRKKWKHQLQYLYSKDGIKKKDIRIIFDWYKHHIGEEFVPDVRSAKSFRIKFDNLVAAKLRYADQVDKGTVKIKYKKRKKR